MLRHIKLKTKLDSDAAPSRIDILSSVLSSSSFNSLSSGDEDSCDDNCNQSYLRDSTEWTTYVDRFSPHMLRSFSDHNNLKRKVSFDVVPTEVPKRMKFDHYNSSKKHNILFQAEDSKNLNELHCLVRRNIEFFVATDEDIRAPCPGRKESIRKGQVGLRCINCRNTLGRERMKRAVCYPSSVDRVYRCVSDMKFDHFPHCLPPQEKALFQQLKQCFFYSKKGLNTCTYGPGTTSQYYRDSATNLGLRDSKDGNFVVLKDDERQSEDSSDTLRVNLGRYKANLTNFHPYDHGNEASASSKDIHLSDLPPLNKFTTRILAEPDDIHYLNPIHCFVRQNVEVFSAEENDISLPAPGRKSQITLGQIGIRCIHCKTLNFKQRVKRAICYPPTISGIYHSVSNMKFDHFAACRGLSSSKRQEFVQLKSLCFQKDPEQTKPSKRGNSTARYYAESARKLGLVDTHTGIRTVYQL